MLNIFDQKINTNQNVMEIPPHPCHNGYLSSRTQTNVGEEVGKKESLNAVCGNANECDCYGK
jgi:hypothetical protein